MLTRAMYTAHAPIRLLRSALPRLLLLCFLAGSLLAERRSLRLLTVGNSFAENALTCLPELAAAGGKELTLGRANTAGCSLDKHAAALEAFEHDPLDPRGRPYSNLPGMPELGPRHSLVELLDSAPWDAVTLQQVSTRSFLPETYHPHAEILAACIRRHAPQARLWALENWAYREDSPLFHDGKGLDQERMYQGIHDSYRALAVELGLGLLPVGSAFQSARRSPDWHFTTDNSFDPAKASPPALPRQEGSLNVGWHWTDDPVPRLQLDANHANIAGKYLGAVVLYLCLFEAEHAPASYVPTGLTPEQASSLRTIAETCVRAQNNSRP